MTAGEGMDALAAMEAAIEAVLSMEPRDTDAKGEVLDEYQRDRALGYNRALSDANFLIWTILKPWRKS